VPGRPGLETGRRISIGAAEAGDPGQHLGLRRLEVLGKVDLDPREPVRRAHRERVAPEERVERDLVVPVDPAVPDHGVEPRREVGPRRAAHLREADPLGPRFER
jgi:hypothetical protein